MALTETWLNGDERDSIPIADLLNNLPTHNLHHVPRQNRTGGGVGVCIRKSLMVRENQCRSWDSFECIDLSITAHQASPLRLVVVYRPERTRNKQQTFPMFIPEFSTLLELLVSEPDRLLIVGDFNFHVDNKSDREAVTFSELIDLKQHVVPTHIQGHTLDLVLTRTSDTFISEISTKHYLPSDHAAMMCSLSIGRPGPVKMIIKSRKIQDIDIDVFRQDILDSELYTAPSADLSQLNTQYETILSDILDKHAPLLSRTITSRPNAPWYTGCLRKVKSELRRLERRWRSSRLEIDRQIFKSKCRHYNQLIIDSKKITTPHN